MNISAKSFYKRHIRIVPGIKSYVLATIFVFLFGIIITELSWYVDKERVETQQKIALSEQARMLEIDLTNRLYIYEQILRGSNGLLLASDTVTQAEWQQFVQQFDLQKTYPGINGVGFIQYVKDDQAAAYVQMMQAQGYPDLAIVPAGQRTDYAPITLLEPLTDAGRKALGYDILTNKARVEPTNKARDSGKVGISEQLTLISDANVGDTSLTSFAMYVATYKKGTKNDTVEARRTNLNGFIFASFIASNFFDKAIDKSKFDAYKAVEIYDGTSTDIKSLLYKTNDFDSYDKNKVSQSFKATVFDRTWTFRFAGPVAINPQDTQRSTMILIGGVTISFAIAGFLFLVMLTRARAIVYSKQNEAQQAKDDLLSLASHQLRTPATAVKQYLGMILEGYTGDIEPKQLPALQKAYASNERQLDTINQILYVAKADAGRLSINKSKFDLNLLIDDIVLDLEDTNQKIVIERSKKKLMLLADEASIRMVVENLISNASKYSYSDAKIVVKTGVRNDQIYVSIIDQGVGIAPEDFEHLFKKFSRIDNDLSLQVGGSGIGLYIDKVLIELHNGRIEVESHVGKGSTFSIYLPKNTANNLTDSGGKNESL